MRVIRMVLHCERHCGLLRPCWPPVPPSSRALPPLRVFPVCPPVLLLVYFFLVSPCLRSPLLPRALRVSPALLCAIPVLQPRALSLARLPPQSPSRSRPSLYVSPPCLSRAVTRVCHPRALPPPYSVAPNLFFGVSSILCTLGPRLSPHPGCLVRVCVCVGGVYLRTRLWPRLWPCQRERQ